MLDHSCQVQRHTHAERGHDLYETPDIATVSLLRSEVIEGPVWEPACGPGRIVNVLRQRRHMVYATDLIDYGTPDSEAPVDFLSAPAPPFAISTILTNPPFKIAEKFVAHALLLGIPKVVMLLRLAFLESERRRAILDNGLLARVYVFRKRLPMMHRAGWEGRKSSSGMAFAWFVWQHGYRGRTVVERI